MKEIWDRDRAKVRDNINCLSLKVGVKNLPRKVATLSMVFCVSAKSDSAAITCHREAGIVLNHVSIERTERVSRQILAL